MHKLIAESSKVIECCKSPWDINTSIKVEMTPQAIKELVGLLKLPTNYPNFDKGKVELTITPSEY